MMAKVNALRDVLSTGGEELPALMPSILDKAFKGERMKDSRFSKIKGVNHG